MEKQNNNESRQVSLLYVSIFDPPIIRSYSDKKSLIVETTTDILRFFGQEYVFMLMKCKNSRRASWLHKERNRYFDYASGGSF